MTPKARRPSRASAAFSVVAPLLPLVIETPRLQLSPWRFEDLNDLLAYATDPEWGRYLPVPQPYDESHARSFLASVQLYDRNQHATWAIREGGRAIGGVNLRLFEGARIGELGYSVAPTRWGRGYATEVARAVIGTAFSTIAHLERIRALADVRNAGSRRVLERCGLRLEGVLRRNRMDRDGLFDEAWYGMLRAEWAEAVVEDEATTT